MAITKSGIFKFSDLIHSPLPLKKKKLQIIDVGEVAVRPFLRKPYSESTEFNIVNRGLAVRSRVEIGYQLLAFIPTSLWAQVSTGLIVLFTYLLFCLFRLMLLTDLQSTPGISVTSLTGCLPLAVSAFNYDWCTSSFCCLFLLSVKWLFLTKDMSGA